MMLDNMTGITKGSYTGVNTDICEALHKVTEPKTGEWIAKSERNRWMRKCSVCGRMQEIDTPKMQGWFYKYCPNCGADMRGGEAYDE